MKDVSEKNFGVIIAFWLPGFLLLWGLSFSRPDLVLWLAKTTGSEIGNFLYASLASLAVGLIINAVRSVIVDNVIYTVFRLPPAGINDARLKDKDVLAAFQAAIENHYRYYQYYANSLVAIAAAAVDYCVARGVPSLPGLSLIAAVLVVLTLASWWELGSFNTRATKITNARAPKATA